MDEENIIRETPWPRTRASVAHDLRALGVQAGMTLIMHSSLSSLGWVSGGPVTVVHALLDVVTTEGTVVMPTQTTSYSDPAQWENPPVPQAWWQIIYETMPLFDPQVTPTRQMGQIVEVFRTWPGTLRSFHPTVSFAAWGRHADYITANHSLSYELGEGSPLARIYELNGYVLLLGVGYNKNTSFHLAEYRAPGAKPTTLGAPMQENGKRIWKSYADIEIDATIFPEIGHDFEQTGQVKIAKVGSATTRLFSQRAGVDFATAWLTRKRTSTL